MAKGKTFSITVPEPIFTFYNNLAEKLGTSRSKIVVNILMDDYIKRTKEQKKIDCVNMLDDNYCERYEEECNADPTSPTSCPSYTRK